MRIKQKELIGKTPRITYTKTLSKHLIVIVQVFDKPKCVNMIKKEDDNVVERHCYPLSDEMYQKYIDNYNKYFAHSQVDGLSVQYNKKKTVLEKIKDCLWN